MSRFWRDTQGASLVEFTLVFFPVIALIAFGIIDFGYYLFESTLASKAAFIGARTAVVSNPVATGVTNPTYSTAATNMGDRCFDPATGAANAASSCPSVNTVCSNGSCTNGYTWSGPAFTQIFTRMQAIFPRLQQQNVQISYQTTGLGFVGRPNGLPMSVTVSIRCMTHRFYFIDALMGWVYGAPAGCPGGTPVGPLIPSSATTLTSEDMATN